MKKLLIFPAVLAALVCAMLPATSYAWTTPIPTDCGITFGDTQKSALHAANPKFDFSSSTDSWALVKLNSTAVRFYYHPTDHILISDTDLTVPNGGLRASTDLAFNFPTIDDPYTVNNLSSPVCIQLVHNVQYPISYTGQQYPTEDSPPDTTPCQYNSQILASSPDCVAPTPCQYNSAINADDPACVAPPPPGDPNQINFIQKASVILAFFIGGVIAYQFRFRSAD